MSKIGIAVLVLFAIGSITYVEGDFFTNAVNDGIYAVIEVILKDKYRDNPRKAECMLDDFKRNDIADKLKTTDLLINQDKLSRELQPYIDASNLKCDIVAFLVSPLGIGIMVLIACMLAISCICCLIRCICR